MTYEVGNNRSLEKKQKIVLGALLIATSIVVLLITFIVLTTGEVAPPPRQPAQDEEQDVVPNVVSEREITGTVVFTDTEGKFIKVAVPGEGMYSVGVGTTVVDLESIEPMSEVTFVASEDTEEGFYDLVVKGDSFKQASTEEKESIEERLERLRTLP